MEQGFQCNNSFPNIKKIKFSATHENYTNVSISLCTYVHACGHNTKAHKNKIKLLRNKIALISHVEKTCSVMLSLVYFAQRDDLQPHPIILLPAERLHSCLWLTKTQLCKCNTFYSFCHCSEVRFVSSCDHCKQYRVKGKC